MKKRFTIVVALLIFAIFVALVWLSVLRSEPAFHGKPESVWIESLGNYRTQAQQGEWQAQIEQWKAFGSNGVPILLKALQKGTEPHRKAYRRIWAKLPSYMRSRLPRPFDSAQLHSNAINILCELPSDAQLAAVREVVQALNNDDSPAVRSTAIHFLNGLPKLDSANRGLILSALVRAIQDQDPDVQYMALTAVKWYPEKPEIVVPALQKALKHTNAIIRINAVRSLRQVAPRAVAEAGGVAVLLECLTNSQPRVRSEAAINLGYMGADPASVVPALLEALSDKAESVRMGAARGLAGFGPQAEAAAPAFLKLREDPAFAVRAEATNALKRIHPGTAAQPSAR